MSPEPFSFLRQSQGGAGVCKPGAFVKKKDLTERFIGLAFRRIP